MSDNLHTERMVGLLIEQPAMTAADVGTKLNVKTQMATVLLWRVWKRTHLIYPCFDRDRQRHVWYAR